MIILSTLAKCPQCGDVCAHLGRKGWSCAMCGIKAASQASWLSVLRESFDLEISHIRWEIQLGRFSSFRLVRLLSRR